MKNHAQKTSLPKKLPRGEILKGKMRTWIVSKVLMVRMKNAFSVEINVLKTERPVFPIEIVLKKLRYKNCHRMETPSVTLQIGFFQGLQVGMKNAFSGENVVLKPYVRVSHKDMIFKKTSLLKYWKLKTWIPMWEKGGFESIAKERQKRGFQ